MPKKLPDTRNDCLFDVCNEFSDYLSTYDSLHGLHKQFEYVSDVSRMDAQKIHKKIQELAIGVVGFFIEKQNASIDFRKISQNEIVISVYYTCAPLSDIYPNYKSSRIFLRRRKRQNSRTRAHLNAGEKKNGSYTITTVSPIKRIAVGLEEINGIWIRQLYALATNEMDGSLPSSMSQTRKKHVNEVANPKYVIQWLIGTLNDIISLSNNYKTCM